jgi:hypothetical protein
MCNNIKLEVVQGSLLEYQFILTDENDAPLDLSNYDFEMQIRKRDSTDPLVWSVNSKTQPSNGWIIGNSVFIKKTIDSSVTSGLYNFDIDFIEKTDDTMIRTFVSGLVRIKKQVTINSIPTPPPTPAAKRVHKRRFFNSGADQSGNETDVNYLPLIWQQTDTNWWETSNALDNSLYDYFVSGGGGTFILSNQDVIEINFGLSPDSTILIIEK